MTSRWTGFRSPLKAGMEMFLAHKRALGYQVRTTESVLRLLDGFWSNRAWRQSRLSRQQ